MSVKGMRWENMNHSEEPLWSAIVGARSSKAIGPIPEFLAKKSAEQAPKTLAWYQEALGQLWTFLEERELTTLGDFSEHNVNLFRVYLRQRGASANTIANRLRAIKAFARWMVQRGWTERNVLEHLNAPQSMKPEFDLIPDDVRSRLFGLYPNDTFLGSRNLAILAVLSDTGLRREEVAHLLLGNFDMDAQVLKVYSDKTEEWRYVPLTDELIATVRNYLRWRVRYFAQSARHRFHGNDVERERRPRKQVEELLFVAQAGGPLSPQEVGQILYRASKRLGVRVHPHLFRHDWITRKALDGESPSLVKRWAGHKTYMMTDYYFGVAEGMLGAIKPKRSVLAGVTLPGANKRKGGRPAKSGAT